MSAALYWPPPEYHDRCRAELSAALETAQADGRMLTEVLLDRARELAESEPDVAGVLQQWAQTIELMAAASRRLEGQD